MSVQTSTGDYADVIQEIRSGNKDLLTRIYTTYRMEFVGWAKAELKCPEETAKHIYQDVIIAFYSNIMEGKLDRIHSQLRTYLFGIGKIMVRKRFKKEMHMESLDASEDWKAEMQDLSIEEEMTLTHRQQLLREAIRSLGEVCRKILTLFYFRRYSLESIMNELGYESSDVVKTQKSRCMRSLRKLIQERYKTEFY